MSRPGYQQSTDIIQFWVFLTEGNAAKIAQEVDWHMPNLVIMVDWDVSMIVFKTLG